MGSASSKSESELPENKSANSSASESIHVEFERIEKNLNKSIHSELVRAEQDIANLFIQSETPKASASASASNPEEISITVGSSSDKSKKSKKSKKSSKTESDTISATSPVTPGQEAEMKKLPTMSSSSESESVVASKDLKGGFTESEIDIRVVPLTNQLNGGASYLQFSESSPFITSEVFKKSLEQNGGTAESEFDSNKLLNIIMQMGGNDSDDKKSDSDSESDDEDEESESLFSDDDEEDDEEDEDKSDVFTDDKEPIQVARLKHKNTSSMSKRLTPGSDDSSSSSSSDSSSSSSSSSTSSSSSSSSSSSDEIVTPIESSIGLNIPRRARKDERNLASLGGLNSSDSASVYILSSESSIGSRDINLLSFDEPAWGKPSKKSKKSKK